MQADMQESWGWYWSRFGWKDVDLIQILGSSRYSWNYLKLVWFKEYGVWFGWLNASKSTYWNDGILLNSYKELTKPWFIR